MAFTVRIQLPSRARAVFPALRLFGGTPASRELHTTCPRCAQSVRSLMPPKKKSFREGGYILLVIPIVTFCLGTWQYRRRKWKLGLIQDLEERTHAAPVDFPRDLDELGDLEYKKVVVKGQFDHSQELYIQPRAPVGSEEKGGGFVSGVQSQSGAYVVTPFLLADRDLAIMVNRGWVPRDRISPHTRQAGQVTGDIELVGVVRHTEKRPPFQPQNDVANNRWMHRDINSMAQMLGTAPIFIDADKNSTVAEGPLGGQTRVSLRNEHMSYMFTWYSLCAITTFMWYSKYMK